MLRKGKGTFPNSSPLKPKTFLENCEAPEWQDLNIPVIEQNNVQITTDQEKANVLKTFFMAASTQHYHHSPVQMHVQNLSLYFFPHAISLWNNLPSNTVILSNVHNFNEAMYEYFCT